MRAAAFARRTRRWRIITGAGLLAGVLLAWLMAAGPAAGQPRPPAITDFTAPAAMENPQLSPDGRSLLFVREPQPADPAGTPNQIVIIDLTDPGEPRATRLPLPDMTVRWAAWGNNERVLLGLELMAQVRGAGFQAVRSDGTRTRITEIRRSQIMSVRRDGQDPVMLFDFSSRQFNHLFNTRLDQVSDFLLHDPDHVLLPARSSAGSLNLYRVNIETGRARVAVSGSEATIAFFTNAAGEATMRWDLAGYGQDLRILVRAPGTRRWRTAQRVPVNEFQRLQRDYEWTARSDVHDEALVYWNNPETGTTGLYRYAFSTRELAGAAFSHPEYDVSGVIVDPLTLTALGVTWSDTRRRLMMFDEDINAHLPALAAFFGEDTLAFPVQRVGERVLIKVTGPGEPGVFYLYDMDASQIWPIGDRQPLLARRALARVSVHDYGARDGTGLFGYLTWPQTPAGDPPPLVVLPHGGPEARDHHDFDRLAQLIAAQGYLVFQPQFRGSHGFGRAFAEAGYGQWGGLIQSDITDGVRDLLERGLVDPDRVCAVGWSFGGYSALMQAVLEPGLYRCVIAGAAPSDLPDLLGWLEDEGGEVFDYARRAMGDPNTAMDQLIAYSPARRAREIQAPVLLLHGRRDGVVPVEQSRIMERALKAARVEHSYIPHNGGHNIATDRQWAHVATRIVFFLFDHLQTPRGALAQARREMDSADGEIVDIIVEIDPFDN
ncbi:S9 family peptidase [Alkalicaulis satelles]|uniref:S9 family peptidase n=1 Tax=Alkalicaulis satelles TaxID=2609175 RepID=A0A5M6ZHP8_9PROT|nr:prolyl oligopeptidase family serine peptidase [Alkalicaulis satelles]KAA5803615.1 S9 family peptidase [Alkalicaulis satelles]